MRALLPRLRKAVDDAPPSLKAAVQLVANVYQQRAGDQFPGLTADLDAFQAASGRVVQYMREECGITTGTAG
jgi:hypothetical protein